MSELSEEQERIRERYQYCTWPPALKWNVDVQLRFTIRFTVAANDADEAIEAGLDEMAALLETDHSPVPVEGFDDSYDVVEVEYLG